MCLIKPTRDYFENPGNNKLIVISEMRMVFLNYVHENLLTEHILLVTQCHQVE